MCLRGVFTAQCPRSALGRQVPDPHGVGRLCPTSRRRHRSGDRPQRSLGATPDAQSKALACMTWQRCSGIAALCRGSCGLTVAAIAMGRLPGHVTCFTPLHPIAARVASSAARSRRPLTPPVSPRVRRIHFRPSPPVSPRARPDVSHRKRCRCGRDRMSRRVASGTFHPPQPYLRVSSPRQRVYFFPIAARVASGPA